MKKIWTIAKKELTAQFKSPMAYIILIIMLSVFNFFFFVIVDENREASLRDVFVLMEFLFVFFIPLLTMKVFAEEKSVGTMEFLMTTPTGNTTIVLGKYLGILLLYGLIIFLTLPYYLMIEIFGQPDRWTVLTGYFGILLEGALFIAIGLLTSSWTKNQIIAALTAYVVTFFLYFSLILLKYIKGLSGKVIFYSNIMAHSSHFFHGLITTSDVIYFSSGIFLCLVLTRLSIENRLWR